MAKVYLRNTVTDIRYEVVKKDPKTNLMTLKGPSGQPFDQPYDKEWLKANNYVVEQG